MTKDEVTRILKEAGPGTTAKLLPVVYAELRRIADVKMAREFPGQTLQATGLVHEAYLRLVGSENGKFSEWSSRAHFFGAAAEAMRRILVERARAKGASKRGGSWRREALDLSQLSIDDVPGEIIDLDDALSALAKAEPEKSRLVELRFFGGLSMDEAASALGISSATANRRWAYARAWLFSRMTDLES